MDLHKYQQELQTELQNILGYWMKYAIDNVYGGFAGQIDNVNHADVNAAKGSVLNARILWAFSAGYNLTQDIKYLKFASRAYSYITAHFIDKESGGVFWTVDYKGQPLDTKKQVYAIAFTIYGLSEYYKASKDNNAKDLAISLYNDLIQHAFDKQKTGFFEAFARDWQPIADLRLSAKDANEKKTMNTHLHVLEAFSTLYSIWSDEGLYGQIWMLIQNFSGYIVDKESSHLKLFFDEGWASKSDIISYGHDIEAAWLLQEAAEAIRSKDLTEQLKMLAVKMAKATEEGLDSDGGLFYELEPSKNHLIKEKHWWVQAEAMVGFFNAYEVSGDDSYLQKSLSSWEFVKQQILDRQYGEWIWGIDEDGKVMLGEDKAGLWKCPYHNSRACIEIIKRIKKSTS